MNGNYLPKEKVDLPKFRDICPLHKLVPRHVPFSTVDFAAIAIDLGQRKCHGLFLFLGWISLGIASWLIYAGQWSLDRYIHAKRGVCKFEADVYQAYNITCAACDFAVGVELPWEWDEGDYHMLVVKKWKVKLHRSYYDGYMYPAFSHFRCCKTVPAVDCCAFRQQDMRFEADPWGRRPTIYCDDFAKLKRPGCPEAPWECHLIDGHLLPPPIPRMRSEVSAEDLQNMVIESDPRPIIAPEKLFTGHGTSWQWELPLALAMIVFGLDFFRCASGRPPFSVLITRFVWKPIGRCLGKLLLVSKFLAKIIEKVLIDRKIMEMPENWKPTQLVLVKPRSFRKESKDSKEEQERRMKQELEAALRIQRFWRIRTHDRKMMKLKNVVRKAARPLMKPLQPIIEPLRKSAATSRRDELRDLRAASRLQVQQAPPNSKSSARNASRERMGRHQNNVASQHRDSLDSMASKHRDSMASQTRRNMASHHHDSTTSQHRDSVASQHRDSMTSQHRDSVTSQQRGSVRSSFRDSITSLFRDSGSFFRAPRQIRRLGLAARRRRRQQGQMPTQQDSSKLPQGQTATPQDFRKAIQGDDNLDDDAQSWESDAEANEEPVPAVTEEAVRDIFNPVLSKTQRAWGCLREAEVVEETGILESLKENHRSRRNTRENRRESGALARVLVVHDSNRAERERKAQLQREIDEKALWDLEVAKERAAAKAREAAKEHARRGADWGTKFGLSELEIEELTRKAAKGTGLNSPVKGKEPKPQSALSSGRRTPSAGPVAPMAQGPVAPMAHGPVAPMANSLI